MKILLPIFILLLAFSVFGQTKTLQQLQLEKAAIETEIAELLVKYSPEYFKVKQAQERLNVVDEQIKQLATKKTSEKPKITFTVEEQAILAELNLLSMTAELCKYEVSKCKDLSEDFQAVYTKISKSPKLVNHLLASSVAEYERMRPQAQSAPQLSQIANEQTAELLRVLVIQNQRIIELLEKLTQKK